MHHPVGHMEVTAMGGRTYQVLWRIPDFTLKLLKARRSGREGHFHSPQLLIHNLLPRGEKGPPPPPLPLTFKLREYETVRCIQFESRQNLVTKVLVRFFDESGRVQSYKMRSLGQKSWKTYKLCCREKSPAPLFGFLAPGHDNDAGLSAPGFWPETLEVVVELYKLSYYEAWSIAFATAKDVSSSLQNAFFEGVRAMCKSKTFTDVKILCGDRSFYTYKILLASFSGVFQAMFKHKEFVESQSNEVKVTDVTPEVMEVFLDSLLDDDINQERMKLLGRELFMAAEKYQVEILKDRLRYFLAKNCDVDSCVEDLILGYLCHEDVIISTALEVVRNNKDVIMESEQWKEMVDKHPPLKYKLSSPS